MIIKKQSMLLLTSFLIILSITSVVYASNAFINVDNLNVRSGPGQEYETIGQVNQSESYEVIQEQENWIEINYGNTSGWVSKEFITTESTDNDEVIEEINKPSTSEETNFDKVTIRYDQTNIRNQPSTDGAIIGSLNSGETLIPTRQINEWFEVEWNKQIGYIPAWLIEHNTIDFDAFQSGVKNKIIVIDAGHGGRDVGAIGVSGHYEKDYTLRTAYKLKQDLEILGAKVILTRSNDYYLSLGGRASLSNFENADVFLSIHYNSTPQYPSANGISTYYYSDRDELLAKVLREEVIKVTNMEDRGTDYGNFQVNRMNHRPSILLELGFLSNIFEEQNIQSSAFQDKITRGIINGLERYFR